jgi:hypothetical protein
MIDSGQMATGKIYIRILTMKSKITDRHQLCDGSALFIATHDGSNYGAYIASPELGVAPETLAQNQPYDHCLELIADVLADDVCDLMD